jgi:hypothetical protein
MPSYDRAIGSIFVAKIAANQCALIFALRETLKNYPTRSGVVKFPKKILIYYV